MSAELPNELCTPHANEEAFRKLLLADTPFLDVRAPQEFAKGAIPGAVNFPILNDEERAQVGTTYVKQGSDQAVELGHRLVSGEIKQKRVQAWSDHVRTHPETHVYCWRGGMRSGLAKQWLNEAGLDVPKIEGGYKALRHTILRELEAAPGRIDAYRIGGRTGSAKTELILELNTGIDLEGHANHRGSSFGRRVTPPPTQTNFENTLAIDLLKRTASNPNATFFFEDEGQQIGAVRIPQTLFAKMRASSLLVVETPLEDRANHILQAYVVQLRQEFHHCHPQDGEERYREHQLAGLKRVRNRLGHVRYDEILDLMSRAFDDHQQRADTQLHRQWIVLLLRDYYDPMYEYQLGRVKPQITYRGSYDEVLDWARSHVDSST